MEKNCELYNFYMVYTNKQETSVMEALIKVDMHTYVHVIIQPFRQKDVKRSRLWKCGSEDLKIKHANS